jgi:hypothetical protein
MFEIPTRITPIPARKKQFTARITSVPARLMPESAG